MVVVAKFGGAALADADAIRHAASIIQDTRPDVVVASAMAGVTDALQEIASGGGDLDAIKERHRDVVQTVADGKAVVAVDLLLAALDEAIRADGDGRTDRILAQGERLSTTILAGALRQAGDAAVAREAADVGLRTHGPFGQARPDLEAIHRELPARIAAEAPATVVLTGFYGVDGDGRITSFGRGGSDLVAALVGVALVAERVELWKDVPGFMTADPRAVPDARLVRVLEYQEAAELAHFGAKVLHPMAIGPLEDAGIPVHIRSLIDPASEGSRIIADAPRPRGTVRSAASRDGLAVLRLNGPDMGSRSGIGRQVFDALGDAGVNVLNLANSQATFALLIQGTDADRARDALEPLIGTSIRSIDVIPDRSLVCVVGRGLGETPGSAARLFGAVAERGVNIDMISLGASETAIDLVVPTAQRQDTLQGLHDAFVEKQTTETPGAAETTA